MRSLGTPATVFKMMGNKRSPAHLDWQERPHEHHPSMQAAGWNGLGWQFSDPPIPRV